MCLNLAFCYKKWRFLFLCAQMDTSRMIKRKLPT